MHDETFHFEMFKKVLKTFRNMLRVHELAGKMQRYSSTTTDAYF